MGLSNLSNGLGALRFMKPTFQRAALAAVLGLGLVVSAAAQDRAPGAGGPRGPHGGDRQKLFEERRHRQEQRLHDVLQIKPEQETAFRTFVASLEQARPQRGQRQRGGQAGERETLTTPERLDRQAQRLADAQQRLQKQSAAVKTFYTVLTVDQRKAFDSMGGLGRGGGFRRGGLVRSRFEGPPIR
jgi:hypothetical protein